MSKRIESFDAPVDGEPAFMPDPRLTLLLANADSSEEARLWAGLTELQRVKAIQRIKAFDRFLDPVSKISAKQAAADAGVELGRFYQMVRAWKQQRSLRSVGTRVTAAFPRQKMPPSKANALQSQVKNIVDNASEGDTVNSLARKLGEASALDEWPAMNTLRKFIEREQRRQRRESLAGVELLFDLSASSLQREDGQPYVIFFVIDRATGLILGQATGEVDDCVAGYRKAAADSLRRITSHPFQAAIWADQLERAQLVPGADSDALAAFTAEAQRQSLSLQLTGPAKVGSYVRKYVGLKLGTIRLMPARTFAETVTDATGTSLQTVLTADEASARIELAVADYTAEVLAGLNLNGMSEPPKDVHRLLVVMAAA